MSDASNKILEVSKAHYHEVLSQYEGDADQSVVISHFGEFSQDFVNTLTIDVEERMIAAEDKRGVIKRIFSILIEGLQNIRLHGERTQDDQQLSFFILANDAEAYHITFANLVYKDNESDIAERIQTINGLEKAELKALYMEVLTNGEISNKGGAGLGFITVAMKAKNELNHQFLKVDDELSFFTVNVRVERWWVSVGFT